MSHTSLHLRPEPALWRHGQQLLRGRAPGQLIIQYTDKCNAGCPQCDMRIDNPFTRSTMDLESACRAIDHAAEQGVAALSITGGEPLLYLKDVALLLKRAKAAGIKYTRTGTNGFMLMNPQRADFEQRVNRLAETLLDAGVHTFWISLDSADLDWHESLRRLPGVTAGIARALPLFHRSGLYPSVNLGINRYTGGRDMPEQLAPNEFEDHFRAAFRRFYTNVIELGFTIVNCCYPMSVPPTDGETLSAVYQASADDRMVQFTPHERALLYRALYDTIPEFRKQIRIFSPRSSLLALYREHLPEHRYRENGSACRGGIDFFFVDARDGNAFPCGYRGQENLGKYWELDLSKQAATTAHCRQCDWECWRDPSELCAPVLGLLGQPWQWLKRLYTDREYFTAWREDLAYMRACDYFDATQSPDYGRLSSY